MLPERNDFLSQVELSFHYVFPCTKEKQSFTNSTTGSWVGVGLGRELFPAVKLLFPSFWSYLIRT